MHEIHATSRKTKRNKRIPMLQKEKLASITKVKFHHHWYEYGLLKSWKVEKIQQVVYSKQEQNIWDGGISNRENKLSPKKGHGLTCS